MKAENGGVVAQEMKKLRDRRGMRESWNHSPSKAAEFAKDRRKFRRNCERRRAEGSGEDPDVAVPRRNPGRQRGAPGVSHHGEPEDNQMAFVVRMRRQCSRSDLRLLSGGGPNRAR